MNKEDLIPLDKLITRLRTDLHLADIYAESLPTSYPKPDVAIQRKNKRKASILFYLEELKSLKESKRLSCIQ